VTNAFEEVVMKLETKVFEFCNGKYANLSELAKAMGISVSQIYRVRQGKRNINQKFVVGAIGALPEYKIDELFYVHSELPSSDPDEKKTITRSLKQRRRPIKGV